MTDTKIEIGGFLKGEMQANREERLKVFTESMGIISACSCGQEKTDAIVKLVEALYGGAEDPIYADILDKMKEAA